MQLAREFILARRGSCVLLVLCIAAAAAAPLAIELGALPIALLRILVELTCTVLFCSIFIVTWHGSDLQRSSRPVTLATGFLCAALFSVLSVGSNALSGYLAGPDAITRQSALLFDLLWHLTAALVLFSYALEKISTDISREQSRKLLRFSLGAAAVLSVLVFCLPIHSPWMKTAIHITQMVTVVMFVIAALTFYRHVQTRQALAEQAEKSFLFAGCTALALAGLCVMAKTGQNDLLTVTGQISQVIAIVCIYMGLVASGLRAPLVELARTRQELISSRNRYSAIIQTANEGIITIDARHQIILFNSAAEKIFGYADQQMMGMHLDTVIPVRHRATHSQYIKHFGETGTSVRQMADSADYAVTGLKKNGEEFPIEASISSLLEGDQRLFTVIFRDISERRLAQQKMAQIHQELSELSQSLQTVREEERKHISRELHDDLGQLLAALRMDFTILTKKQPDNPALQPILGNIDRLILDAIAVLRRIATDLRPRALDEGGLYFALRTLQKEFSTRHGLVCELIAVEEELTLNDAISTTVYRVIQESLTNVARHAQATAVRIELSKREQYLWFKITDNGCGIGGEDFIKRQSFGLIGMRERLRGLHGELQVSGDPGKGTCIEGKVPLSATP